MVGRQAESRFDRRALTGSTVGRHEEDPADAGGHQGEEERGAQGTSPQSNAIAATAVTANPTIVSPEKLPTSAVLLSVPVRSPANQREIGSSKNSTAGCRGA